MALSPSQRARCSSRYLLSGVGGERACNSARRLFTHSAWNVYDASLQYAGSFCRRYWKLHGTAFCAAAGATAKPSMLQRIAPANPIAHLEAREFRQARLEPRRKRPAKEKGACRPARPSCLTSCGRSRSGTPCQSTLPVLSSIRCMLLRSALSFMERAASAPALGLTRPQISRPFTVK